MPFFALGFFVFVAILNTVYFLGYINCPISWLGIYILYSGFYVYIIAVLPHVNPRVVRLSAIFLLLTGLLARLVVLNASEAPLSSDIYRYMWEGRVVEAGFNPYSLAPDSEQLSRLAEDHAQLWTKVEHKNIPAIYGPVAEYIFSILPPKPLSIKLLMISAETILVLLVLSWLTEQQLPRMNIMLYFLAPLPILENAISGHLDVLMMLFVVLAIYLIEKKPERTLLPAVLFALALGIKASALIAVFVVAIRVGKHNLNKGIALLSSIILLFGILSLPLLTLQGKDLGYGPTEANSTYLQGSKLRLADYFEGLSQYASHWEFNSSLFRLVNSIPIVKDHPRGKALSKLLIAILVLTIIFQITRKSSQLLHAVARSYLVLLLGSSTVYPWYLIWFAPLVPLMRNKLESAVFVIFLLLAPLSYQVLLHPESWSVPEWLLIIEYLPVYGALLLLYVLHWGNLQGVVFDRSCRREGEQLSAEKIT